MNRSSLATAGLKGRGLFLLPCLLLLLPLSVAEPLLAGHQAAPLLLADKGNQKYDWGEDRWRDADQRKDAKKKAEKSKKNKKKKANADPRSGKEHKQAVPGGYRSNRQGSTPERGSYKPRENSRPTRSDREQGRYSRSYSEPANRAGRSGEYEQKSYQQSPRSGQPVEHRGARKASGSTLDAAVSRVRQQTGGKILSAETVRGEDGAREHRIRVFTEDGRVKRYRIKAD